MVKPVLIVRVIFLFVVIAATLSSVQARPAVPPWRPSPPFSTETAVIQIEDEEIDAELADTSELRSRGLSFRKGLEDGTGMLFVYPDAGIRSFWMPDMNICLDIIWIEEGRVAGVAENACPEPAVAKSDLQRYVSPVPVTYVLEVPAFWMRDNGIEVGAEVEITFPEGYQPSA
jgi:uncharacterized protein